MQGFDPNGPQFQEGPPQPPDPQVQLHTGLPAPGPSGLTLEQAAGAAGEPVAGAKPPNPYLQKYQQYLEVAHQMVAPAKYDPLPPAGGASTVIGNILTMGLSGLSHEHYRKNYNVAVDQHNKELELKAAEFAAGMMHDDSKSEDADFSKRLRLLQAEVGVAQLNRGLAKDQIQANTMPAPTTPQGEDLARARGFHPSTEHPGRWEQGGGTVLPKNPDGSYGLPGPPAAPGSPAAKALGTDAGTAGDISPEDQADPAGYARRRDIAGKTAAKTQAETATSNLELDRNAKIIEDYFNDPKFDMAIAQTLMPGVGSSVLGPGRAYLQRKAGKGGPAYLGLARTTILPAIRALEGGTKGATLRGGKTLEQIGLTKPIEALVNGTASQAEAKQTKQIVLDALQKIRESMGATGPQGQGTPTPGPSTSTTTTPGQLGKSRRLSSGKLILEEP